MKKLFLLAISLLVVTNCWAAVVTWQGDDLVNPTYWNDTDNWDTETVPANGDDVVIANAANCNVNTNTANLKSLDMTGYTGTLSGASSITITGAATSTVTCKFAGTITWTGILTLSPAAADTIINLTMGTLTTAGTCGGITISGNKDGAVNIIDNITIGATKSVTIGGATTHFDGATDDSGLTHSWGKFACSGYAYKTVYLGTASITITGTSLCWDLRGAVYLTTWDAGTSTITFTGSSDVQFGTDAITYYNVIFSGSGTVDIYQANTYNNLTRTGTAVKTDVLKLRAGQTINGALTLSGNSSINRLLIYSDTLGTARAITLGAAATCKTGSSNVDFRDITMSGGAANERDLSAITGGSGDCGGNTGITFTTADNWYFHNSDTTTRNWSDATYWFTETNGGGDSGDVRGFPPLPQDTCYFDSNSFAHGHSHVTADLPRIGSFDWTGSTNSPELELTSVAIDSYGSTNLTNLGVLSMNKALSWTGRGAHTLTSAGKTFAYYIGINNYTGSITLTDALSATLDLTLSSGTFDADIYNVTVRGFGSRFTTTRTLSMGSGTWTLSGTDPWNTDFGMTTLNAETSTISLTNTGTKSFTASTNTFNNLTSVGGASSITIITNSYGGNPTFNTLTVNAPGTLKVKEGLTVTVSSFIATGDASNLIHIDSVTASAATLSDTTGTNTVHYCHIGETGSANATGGATWDASDNCQVNASTGWTTASNYTGHSIGVGIGRGIFR